MYSILDSYIVRPAYLIILANIENFIKPCSKNKFKCINNTKCSCLPKCANKPGFIKYIEGVAIKNPKDVYRNTLVELENFINSFTGLTWRNKVQPKSICCTPRLQKYFNREVYCVLITLLYCKLLVIQIVLINSVLYQISQTLRVLLVNLFINFHFKKISCGNSNLIEQEIRS